MRVIVTGASGVLGTAVHSAFVKAGHSTLGLAYTRPTAELKRVNLVDKSELEATIRDYKPDWIIHCAAERKPDVAEKDPEGTRKLNVSVPEHLAQLSKGLRFVLVYISTDYVFDGTSPPYVPSSKTNPLNVYGQTKRDGELSVLGVEGAKPVVFRVPVLYGPAPKNTDSAVNVLLDVVQDQSGKSYRMDHFQTRYPTNVLDIASFLVRLAESPCGRSGALPPILHYSAPEPFTKYEMCLIFARILGLPHAHIIPDANEPPPGSTPRPKDTQLYVRETEELGVEGGLGTTGFDEWWEARLRA